MQQLFIALTPLVFFNVVLILNIKLYRLDKKAITDFLTFKDGIFMGISFWLYEFIGLGSLAIFLYIVFNK